MNNFTVYLNELISEAFENIDEDTRNDLLATAVLKKGAFIDAVNDLNTGLFNRMMKKKAAISRFITKMPRGRLEPAEGDATLCAAFIETDDATGRARRIEPVRLGGRLSESKPPERC